MEKTTTKKVVITIGKEGGVLVKLLCSEDPEMEQEISIGEQKLISSIRNVKTAKKAADNE